MASISSKSALKESAVLDFDNASDTSDSEGSMNGFIRASASGAASGDSREFDTGNEENAEVEDGEDEEDEGDSDSDSDAWESESFIEDTLHSLGNTTQFEAHEDACTLEEAQQYRRRLREVGIADLLRETIFTKTITARKLITAFGIRPPSFLDEAPDEALIPLLQAAMGREMTRRRKIPEINTLEDVVRLLRESKNILVLTGAGISTSLGIPDFRSKDNGLYARLTGLGLSDPQEVFDIDVFQEDPRIFYSIAKDILPSTDKFSPTHAFIELLQSKNKLLTQYTQNIDNLETRAGIKPEKLIQCHGSFATASCVKCKYKVPGETIFPDLRAGRVAKCDMCLKTLAEVAKVGRKRKRGGGQKSGRESTGSIGGGRKQKYSEDSSADEDENLFQEAGVMKPDITFFGEQLPASFHDRLIDHDREKCDLLICIGTSLKVAPVSEIIGFLPPHVPQIYISKTPVTHVEFDVEFLGSCDDVVFELCRLMNWEFKHEMIPAELEIDVKLAEGTPSRYIVSRKE